MKNLIVIMVATASIALGFSLGGCSGEKSHTDHAAGLEASAKPAAVRWLCPMHPTYTSDRKGECPICGMDLVEASTLVGQGGDADSDVPGMASLELDPKGVALAGVRTIAATIQPFGSTIRAVGLVTADDTRVHSIQTRISGWIETLAAGTVGDPVKRGEPLLTIYSPELVASQEELLRARALAAAAANHDPGAVARAAMVAEGARRRLRLFDVPDSFVERLESTGKVSRTVPLSSPVTGFVTARTAYAGMAVMPGMEMFRVADLSAVWIDVSFYEYEARYIVPGLEVAVSLPHDPGLTLSGTIDYVYPSLDEAARTLSARVVLANDFGQLRPGMYADVTVELHSGEALVIPDDAILDTGLRKIVFVSLGSSRFEPREVEVGSRSGGRAQILGGLTAGEEVVIRANFLLDSESRIRAALLKPAGTGDAPTPGGGHDHGGGQ